MVRLRPFKRQDIRVMLPWVADERVFAMWCSGAFAYPLTKEQMEAHMARLEACAEEWMMTALDEQGRMIGCFSVKKADYERNCAHLGMIVVDDTRRGQGLGCQMVEKAVEYGFAVLGVDRVTLGVFTCNPRAHACYCKAGLADDYLEKGAYIFHEEVWDRQHMETRRQS